MRNKYIRIKYNTYNNKYIFIVANVTKSHSKCGKINGTNLNSSQFVQFQGVRRRN